MTNLFLVNIKIPFYLFKNEKSINSIRFNSNK